jgi:hypothetical protein
MISIVLYHHHHHVIIIGITVATSVFISPARAAEQNSTSTPQLHFDN